MSVLNSTISLVKNAPYRDMEVDMLTLSRVMLALTSTLSLNRLVYWFQLHDKVGPIVINVSRVIIDIFTITTTYVASLLAFSVGLVFVITTDHVVELEKPAAANATTHALDTYFATFKRTLVTLFWSVLGPGKPDDIEPDGISGTVATLLFAAYQILVAVILLNLLIAIMNATVQKVQDHQQLYWKFVRTSVWIEFMDDNNALPPPFNLVHVLWSIVFGLWYLTFYQALRFHVKMTQCSGKPFQQRQCPLDETHARQRQRYVNLMLKLIERFCEEKVKRADDPKYRDQIKTFKQEVSGIRRKHGCDLYDY